MPAESGSCATGGFSSIKIPFIKAQRSEMLANHPARMMDEMDEIAFSAFSSCMDTAVSLWLKVPQGL